MQTQPLASSSRLGFGCLILFALPFAGLGLLALFAGIRDYPTKPNAIVAIIVGGVFTLVGFLLIIGTLYGKAAAAKTDELKARNPNKPWMWREDWANGIIKDSNKAGTIGIWIFTVIWNAISFPTAFLASPQLGKGNWMVIFILLFPFIGVCMLIGAIYQTLRSMKFGTSTCHLQSVPVVPGRAFRGDVQLNVDAAPSNGYHVRISSIHEVTTRTGRNRSTTERLLWDTEVVVDASAAMRGPTGTTVPFQLATPPDAQVTDESDLYDRYFWRLSASAELPGVDYAAQFALPVFQTGEAADGSEYASFQQRHRAEAARHQVAPTAGVRITPLPTGGEEFRMQPRKTVGTVLQTIVVLAAWNAGIAAMIHFHVPWGFPAVFIAIDLLLLASAFDYFLGRTTLTVDTTGVRARREWLGAGSVKSYEAATIESIDGTSAGQNSKAFGITLKLRDGGTRLLGGYLTDRDCADTVAAKMMADLGRNATDAGS